MRVDVNNVRLTGTISREPQVAATGRGTTVLTLPVTVATMRPNGETADTFVDVVVYGKTANGLLALAQTGMEVTVEKGTIRSRSWRDPNTGTMRSAVYVAADAITLEHPLIAAARERMAAEERSSS